MTNLHQQLLEEFDKYGDGEWGFLDKAPILFSDEAKRYIKVYFPRRHQEIKSFIAQAFRRISAQSEREVVERVRKEIKELKFRDYEGFECRGYDTAGTVNQRLDSVLASLDTLEKKV